MPYNPNEPRDSRGRWTTGGTTPELPPKPFIGTYMDWARYFDALAWHDSIVAAAEAGPTIDVILPDGKSKPIAVPPGYFPDETARIGESLANLPLGVKEAKMYELVQRGGPMDYQRPDGVNVDKRLIPIANYNYGVLAAAAGYSDRQAVVAAGIYNTTGTGNKEGPYFTNKHYYPMIAAGLRDYRAGKFSKPVP
jgi:guanyl-specific ribonuclease Sa